MCLCKCTCVHMQVCAGTHMCPLCAGQRLLSVSLSLPILVFDLRSLTEPEFTSLPRSAVQQVQRPSCLYLPREPDTYALLSFDTRVLGVDLEAPRLCSKHN